MPETIERPSTPPNRTTSLGQTQSTPEHIKRIEINRLKAKAAQREKEQAAFSSHVNANNKRPLAEQQPSSSKPLRRDTRLGTYFEYDLSKMVNSKGGFLIDDGKKVDEELKRKEAEREKQRNVHNLDMPMFLDPGMNPKCRECQSMDIDPTFMKVFDCLVCKSCQREKPEKYSLLTKTECKEDYLLTDPELRDEEAMPHLLKANPHASTYANMMLYLRYQVEEFAWKKWGSPEALDAEFERRTIEKKKKKNKKFEEGLRDLRKRTKEGIWQRRKDAEHKHVFSAVEGVSNGIGEQAEHEQISTSLEVEQIEVNLFRSKSLWLPVRARGVFGGQVISQALVSATNCVDPALALHSLHCYFLTSGSPSTPIIYSVERLREGKSYATRSVKAVQNGKIIFIMLCSFQRPEPWQPRHQWKMPVVPAPEECPDEESSIMPLIQDPKTDPRIVQYFQERLGERQRSPVAIKTAKSRHVDEAGVMRYMYWMKARSIPKYETPFQKASRSVIDFLQLLTRISSASRIMGLKAGGKGPGALSMISTLDHAIWYYSNDFDAGDWLLYVMDCPSAGSGRAVVHGRFFTRDGTLVAVTSQEGVVRADIRDPARQSKL
ncbi:hypothetical protein BDN70DRAFT_915646 [Pholiota conissans]|uniref:DNA repair protein RAD14 n=1 Tax=Pholiota conissans TaxID=109636 RepID=A0A9P6CTT0_9AGAR|nr:hypothetical protein BDN70DRAFT_915646 [Pholiota conissans]